MINAKIVKKDLNLNNKFSELKVNNIVSTVTFDISEKIDLLKIYNNIENTEYNPEKFPGLILRTKIPKATFLIFSSAKMILTGLKDETDAIKAVNIVTKKIEKVGINLQNPEIKIRNLVVSGNLHNSINLNKAAIELDTTMYEPEVFPALIYYMKNPVAVFLVFSNGKFICTKIKNREELRDAVSKFTSIIENYYTKNDDYIDMDDSNNEIFI